MNLLTAEHLTKVFTQRKLLDNADFSINEGEKIGVIGINGTGKSTLLRIIAGLEMPDEGQVVRGRNLTIRYLPQSPVFQKNDTVLDAILHDNVNSLNEWSIESEALAAINRLGLPGASEKVEHLSGGQRKGSRWQMQSLPLWIFWSWMSRQTIWTAKWHSGWKTI